MANHMKPPDAKFLAKSDDSSELWRRNPNQQKSVKDRWPHAQEKPSEPVKQQNVRSGVTRSSGSELKDGSKSHQLPHHTKSRVDEISGRVGAGNKTVVPPQIEPTQSSTPPQTSSQVQQRPQSAPRKDLGTHPHQQSSKHNRWSYAGPVETAKGSTWSRTSSEIKQPVPIPVVPPTPAEAQLNTTQPCIGYAHSSSYVEVLAQTREEVSRLTTEAEQLRKERTDLLGELEAHKLRAQTFQEDFEQERKDREKAHSEVGKIEERYQHQLQSVETQLNHKSQDLLKCKETLATTETALHSQIKQLSNLLIEKDQQVTAMAAENDRLQEEVLNIQQVEQYKKKVDQFEDLAQSREEMTRLTTEVEQLCKERKDLLGELEAHKLRAERFAHESEEWKSRAAEWKGRHDTAEAEVQKERNQREALERKVADLEELNDQLRQESHDLAQSRMEVTRLTTEVEQLHTEKADLLGELEAHRLTKDELEAEQLSEQMKKLVGMNADYIAQINGLKAQVRMLEQEKETLQNELQTTKTEKEKSELVPYRIESFSKLEEGVSKGSGSFGSIHLIEVNGVPCIAKRLHDILVGRGQAEVVDKVQKQSMEQIFHRECVFLSRLRHPNIVQFMGVHYGQDSSDLTLIMECLPMDLEKCLQRYPNLPLSIKISILLDVSYGLLHLHNQKPPIIHRDLTAGNILLTSNMKAKIADLGVSKILDLHPLRGASQTAGPGALAYMPPEALKRVPAYDTKLDDFSFGVVALYVANQEFPMVEEQVTVEAVQKQETHIEKRREWVDRVGKSHPMYELIISTLQDVPDRRPTTSQINAILKQLSKCHPRRFQDIMEMNQHISHLKRAMSELQSKIVEEV